MAPIVKKYKKEYANELLRIAKGDLDSAQALLNSNLGRVENILYIIQQGIEKSIKAVLCFHQVPVVHTHDLDALMADLPKGVQPPHDSTLNSFNQYATIRRYEEGSEELNSEDLNQAYQIGLEVYTWAINETKSS